MELPYMKRPCSNCPFRTYCTKGWLGTERVEEIATSTTFTCHKTSNKTLDKRRQCGGYMLFQDKTNSGRSEFLNLSRAMGIKLDLADPENKIFNNLEEMKYHHRNKS